MKNVTAVMLAAGGGSRFWPLTTNKVFFPFMGKTFFDWADASAMPASITKIVVVASPDNEKIFRSVKFPVPHVVVVQKEPSGMADALLSTEKAETNAPLLILIADDLVNPALFTSVLATAKKRNAFGVLPGLRIKEYQDLGYLTLQGDKILGISEKPGKGNEPSDYVYVSGQYIKDSSLLFQAIRKAKNGTDDVYERALMLLMADHEFVMEPYTDSFASLKYPWHVLDVMSQLFKHLKVYRGNRVMIKKNVVIEGDVWIEDNVKIFENTKIIGPSYIGKNVIIGNNNLIRESHIGANSVTGFNTDITRSYVGNDCWFHSNYVGDSVLENNISMGGGTKLANLRLDEGEIFSVVKNERTNTGRTKFGAIIGSNVRTGVNVSIMPGVKIGAGSFVGAGVTLDKDLPTESFCVVQGGYTVKKNTRKVEAQNRDKLKKYI